jgi:hypothetical protein
MVTLPSALSNGIALAVTAALVATANGTQPPEPPVLDAAGHLTDAFLEEVRRQDAVHWMQQYTVNYTEHFLDYGSGFGPLDDQLWIEERSGYVKANHDTGAFHFTQSLDRTWPQPRGHRGGSATSGPRHYSCQRWDPFYWADRVDADYSMARRLTAARAHVVSTHEESAPTGALLHIVTQMRDARGSPLPGATRRELTLNRSRGYRPQRMVEHNARGTARTDTDIDLVRHEETGIWTASRVHEKVYDLREDGDRLRRETIYEFADLIRRTHLRIRH